MHLCVCVQPVLWNIWVFSPDFPPVGKSDFAELSFSWFTYINGYFCCCRMFHSLLSSRSCSDPPCNLAISLCDIALQPHPGWRTAISQLIILCGYESCCKTSVERNNTQKITKLVQPQRWICSYCESHLNFTIKQPWNLCSQMLINLIFKSLNNAGQRETRKRKWSTEYLNGAKGALRKKWP